MKRTTIVLATLAVLVALVAPAAAAGLGDTAPMQTNCDGNDVGPGEDGGPPGFVADLVPDFLSDLIGSLPVPNFVKSLFGAF